MTRSKVALPRTKISVPFQVPERKMSDPSEFSSEVAGFYRGRSVFVTGATGFMGKVLVEKLLRACPGISNIYVLMRPKRGNDVGARMVELLDTKIFDRLRKERPEVLKKVIPIPGDITAPKLGLSATDIKILTETVSVVFHSAATVKFDEPLVDAVCMNMIGTKSLVQLCQNMTNLEALIHVSTAYSNCNRQEVGEIVYPPPDDPDRILKCVECLDKELLKNLTPYLIKGNPNTYTFTKALAEHIFVKECAGIPAAIVRPSIVTASWKEPFPGWIDNLNGPTGLLTGAGKGVLRTLLCYRELIADLIPVDIAINLLIAVGWHIAQARPLSVPVYNCTSGGLNPIRWGDIESLGHSSLTASPFNDVLWYPGGSFKSSKLVNAVCTAVLHLIPAYLIDAASTVAGKKPVMVKIQKRFQKAISVLEFFTTHEWKFTSNNVTSLFMKLSEQDQRLFCFDVKQVNWSKYMDDYVEGIRLYILKEDPTTGDLAKIRLRRMYFLHKITQILSLFLVTRLVLKKTDAARKMWYSFWSVALYLVRFLAAPITH